MIGQNFKYNGKELTTDLGLNWQDYGARRYMADLGRWFNGDPLADKYYDLSPYAYVANNPIIYVDPNGKEIEIYSEASGPYTYVTSQAYDGDDEFISQTVAALNYLVGGSETAAGLIGGLVDATDFFVSIVSTDDETKVSGKTGDVEFNTTDGLAVDEGTQSPAVNLAHELGHKKNQKDDGNDAVNDRKDTKDSQYTDKEEKKVVTKFEQPIVKELNENGNNEGTRDNHKGTSVPVECSTCNY
jgi:RHS repeat-associated protein